MSSGAEARPPATAGSAGPSAPVEDESAARRKQARDRGTAALRLFRAGRYDEAYPLFRAADEQWHTLPLVVYMARCQEKRGRLLEARALYERALSEPLPENPPEALVRSRESASAELAPLRLRIPTLSVEVRGPRPEEVTLFVDDEVWPQGEPRELDPGTHQVEAMAQSGGRTGRAVELPEGRSISIVLRLGLFAPSSAARTALLPEPPPQDSWPQVAAAASFGLGAAGLGVGTVAGFLVLGRGETLRAKCAQGCAGALEEDLASTRALGDVSTAGFVIGAAGMVAGTAFLLLGARQDKARARTVSARLSPLGGFLEGTF